MTLQSHSGSSSAIGRTRCRFCSSELTRTFVDLGMSPLCETYPSVEQLHDGETYYPLHVRVCDDCFLVQLGEFESRENIFSEYPYFSSYSKSWLKHAEQYCVSMQERFSLNSQSLVLEAASNDGYLLQYFVQRGIPVLGIEPAANVAEVANTKGVPSLVRFFGVQLAHELASAGKLADLIVANNVLAQVPDLNDFVGGFPLILKPDGVLTLEFPHLIELIQKNEFDTIYHEHYSYFSLLTVQRMLASKGMRVFDVETLPTHGGSLRVFACRAESAAHPETERVVNLIHTEKQFGLASPEGYAGFAAKVRKTKLNLLEFLLKAARDGQSVAGYGAPGKSATLLHYCGVTRDLLEYTVDLNPFKQGRHLPGTRIPIYHPDRLRETKPDYILILPWNLVDEIVAQLSYVREWGAKLVVPIPELRLY